jgi:hypothetical protein
MLRECLPLYRGPAADAKFSKFQKEKKFFQKCWFFATSDTIEGKCSVFRKMNLQNAPRNFANVGWRTDRA